MTEPTKAAKTAFQRPPFLIFNLVTALMMVGALPFYLFNTHPYDIGGIAYVVTFVGLSLVRSPHVKRARRAGLTVKVTTHDKEDAFSVVVMALGNNYLPALFILTPFLDFANLSYPPFVFWLGVGFAVAGIYTVYRGHKNLAEYWSGSLELREGHKLMTSGIFSVVRHPIYLGFFFVSLSQWMFLPNWIAGPAGFVTFLFLYSRRVPVEEAMMRKEFGEEWDAYAAKTPALIPNLLKR